MKNCWLWLLFFSLTNSVQSQTWINKQWVSRYSALDSLYNAPTALDANGNTYVTGYVLTTSSCFDFVTIKYNPVGDTLWVRKFNGTANGCDLAKALAVDNTGNVYVTGSVQTASGTSDYATIKYNSLGVQQWVSLFNGTGNSTDEPSGIALDNSGGVYVTGKSKGVSSGYDYATVKYNSGGFQQWIAIHNGTANGDDMPGAIVVQNNRVYVAGTSLNTGTNEDIVTIRYHFNTGTVVWTNTYNNLPAGIDRFTKNNDKGNALVADGNNSVYIVGSTETITTTKDYLTLKVNGNNGSQQWARLHNGYGLDDVATTVGVDGTGNVLVSGTSLTTSFQHEYHTVKYSSSGTLLWVKKFKVGASLLGLRITNSLVIDFTDHIYVCGTKFNGASFDYVIVRYAPSGTEQWYECFDGQAGGNDLASDIAVDNLGQLYVTGTSWNGTNFDFATIKYNQTPVYAVPDIQIEPPASNYLFYENAGQLLDVNSNFVPRIKYYTNNTSPALYFTDNVLSYVLARVDTIPSTQDTLHRIDMILKNSNPLVTVNRSEEGQGYLNYFLGHTPNGVTDVNGFKRLTVPNIYPGIDLQYFSNANGLKYYFVVKPFMGNPNSIEILYAGADSINTNGNTLRIFSSIGNLDIEAHAYQVNASGNPILLNWTPQYNDLGFNTVNLTMGSYVPGLPLIIEIDYGHTPTPSAIANLTWSTFYGGTGTDKFNDSKSDAAGNLYIAGYTANNTFPTTIGAYQTTNFSNVGWLEAVALKFNSSGQPTWATYFGGDLDDIAYGIAVDPSGNVFITGLTTSSNLFTVNPGSGAYFQPSIGSGGGFGDGFLVKLTSGGNAAPWVTYYGGAATEFFNAITSDPVGNIFVTGETESNNFPVQNPGGGAYFQGSLAGPFTQDKDAFLIKFDATTLDNVWATYYGGASSLNEAGLDLTTDLSGNLFVVGRTQSASFPTLDPGGGTYFNGTIGGLGDAFFLKFLNSGIRTWATYYGGFNSSDQANSVVTTGTGDIFIAGTTNSSDFPTLNYPWSSQEYFQSTINSNFDAFVVKIHSSLVREWSTYYGGGLDEFSSDITIDLNGIVYLAGHTTSGNISFPIPNPPNTYNQVFGGNSDSYVVAFGLDLNDIWGTYLGGTGADYNVSVITDINSNLFLIGATNSTNTSFPLDPGGGPPTYFQNLYGGGTDDGYITRFDLAPVILAGIDKPSELNGLFIVYPNPSNGVVTATFANQTNSNIKFVLYNSLGQKIESIDMGNSSGVLSHSFDLAENSTGIYFVQVLTDHQSLSKKIIKQ